MDEILKQVVENILKSGAIGAILIWFMFRLERILTSNTTAVNMNTKIMLCVLDEHEQPSPGNGHARRSVSTHRTMVEAREHLQKCDEDKNKKPGFRIEN